MRNLILSFAIIFTTIVNVFGQDTLVTNVRSITKDNTETTERIDYNIIIDSTKITFVGAKSKNTFVVELTALEETLTDDVAQIKTFKTKNTDKINIFYEMNVISIVAIEKSPNDVTFFLFSNNPKDFPKAK
jgi:hypothetical protein